MPKTTNKSVIPEKLLKQSINSFSSRFEVNLSKCQNTSQTTSNVATRDFYAPWSGREQCEQNPCWKAYGNASNRIWQTASSG